MRIQNGIRHNDATRYHKYCSKRLQRLRSKLKHKNGRNRFVAKAFPTEFADERFLHLPIVETERNYAAHLEMKQAQSLPPNASGLIAIKSGIVKPNQLSNWSKRRLAKALVNATRLLQCCERHCDKQTILEARAYRQLFEGMLAVEKREWQSAMESLVECRRLYSQLASLASSNQTHAAAVNEQLSSIDLHLRTASYYLARLGGGAAIDSVKPNVKDAAAAESARSEAGAAQSKLNSLYWRGILISLPEDLTHSAKIDEIPAAVAAQMVDAASLLSHTNCDLQKLLSSSLFPQSENWQQTIDKFLVVDKACQQSLSLIHASLLDTDTSAESETGHFFFLESIARDVQQASLIEMNMMLLGSIILRYLQSAASGSSRAVSRRHSPTLGVFLSDLIIQMLTALLSELDSSRCPSSLQNSLALASDVLRERIAAWIKVVQDCRAVLVSLSMIKNNKTQEAYVLISSICQSRNRPDRFDIDLALPDSKLWVDSPFFRLGAASSLLDSILTHADQRVEVEAAAALIASSSAAIVADSAFSSVSDADVPILLSNQLNLATAGQLPFKPIPCKPILFDLAESELVAPTMKQMMQMEEPTEAPSLVKKLTSWWRA